VLLSNGGKRRTTRHYHTIDRRNTFTLNIRNCSKETKKRLGIDEKTKMKFMEDNTKDIQTPCFVVYMVC